MCITSSSFSVCLPLTGVVGDDLNIPPWNKLLIFSKKSYFDYWCAESYGSIFSMSRYLGWKGIWCSDVFCVPKAFLQATKKGEYCSQPFLPSIWFHVSRVKGSQHTKTNIVINATDILWRNTSSKNFQFHYSKVPHCSKVPPWYPSWKERVLYIHCAYLVACYYIVFDNFTTRSNISLKSIALPATKHLNLSI